jgi:cell wall-associated NlpC family hydrolase
MKYLCAAFVAIALTAALPAAAAFADPPPTAQSVSGLQAQAQELASQIQADGRKLDELDASYNAALIQYQQLSAKQASLQKAMAVTGAEVAAARRRLKAQALLSYMTGGGPVVTFVSGRAGQDPSLMAAYADIIAGGEQRAAAQYHEALAAQTRQAGALAATVESVSITVADIKADRSQATATLAAQRQALARTTGQLAVLVAQVQAAQQLAEEAAVKASLSARGDLPPATPPAVKQTQTHPPPPSTSTPSPVHTHTAPTTALSTTTTTDPPPTSTPTTTPPLTTSVSLNQPASGAQVAIAYAQAQLGKPYQWGGAGPDSFDCSGLVMMAWEQAGVYFPHLAQDQYDLTVRIPLSDLLPGDLVFFGTPSDVHHVGLYIGSGEMIDAPETGQDVSIQSIYWSDLLAAGRVQG